MINLFPIQQINRTPCQNDILQQNKTAADDSYRTLAHAKIVTILLTSIENNFDNVRLVGVVSNVMIATREGVDPVFVATFIYKVVVELAGGGYVQSPVVVARSIVVERIPDDSSFVLNSLTRVPAGARLPVDLDFIG